MSHCATRSTRAPALPAHCRVCGLDPAPEGEFDDLLQVIAEWSGAAGAAVGFAGVNGWWIKSSFGAVPPESSTVNEGRSRPANHRIDVVPILDDHEARIGELVLYDARQIGPAAELLAARFARLVEERRPASIHVGLPTWIVVTSPVGVLRAVSPHVLALLGRQRSETHGINVFDFIHVGDHERAFDSLMRCAQFPGEQYPIDLRLLHHDGEPVVLEITALVPSAPGEQDIVFEVRETAERSDDDSAVSDQARLLAMIGRGAALDDVLGEAARFVDRTIPYRSAFFLLDPERARLEQIGASSIDTTVLDLMRDAPVSPDSITCGVAASRRHATRCPDITVESTWLARGLTVTPGAGPLSCWCIPVVAGSGDETLGVLALLAPFDRAPRPHETRVTDLAVGIAAVAIERHRAEAQLLHRALHDPLTGLPNRALFLDRLTHAVAHRADPHTYTAVMLIDLDRFKVINDALGHESGDEVLVAVADRLRSCSRAATTIARFGGDEFTVLCEQLDSPREAITIARRLLDCVARPIPLGSGEVSMSMSIGITIVNTEVDHPGSLLRDADAAMYRAKEQGRNRIEIFDAAMRDLALARLDLERSMHESIGRGDFGIVSQPEYDLATGTLVGAEILLRWRHPTRGLVAPSDFIPIAEETGAILPLGEWVLRRACDESRALREAAPHAELFTTWVNISVVQLLQPGFTRSILAILAETGADPERIGLEITESALMHDATDAARALGRLRDLGLRVAIDDFGTGYSSLSYLRHLPADVVKIDRLFIEQLGADPQATSLVAGIVQLAHAVGCTAVAEGIETPEQLAVVRDIGCDIGQGFLLGRPVPVGAPLTPSLHFVGTTAPVLPRSAARQVAGRS